jgi:hypothetical protein
MATTGFVMSPSGTSPPRPPRNLVEFEKEGRKCSWVAIQSSWHLYWLAPSEVHPPYCRAHMLPSGKREVRSALPIASTTNNHWVSPPRHQIGWKQKRKLFLHRIIIAKALRCTSESQQGNIGSGCRTSFVVCADTYEYVRPRCVVKFIGLIHNIQCTVKPANYSGL